MKVYKPIPQDRGRSNTHDRVFPGTKEQQEDYL